MSCGSKVDQKGFAARLPGSKRASPEGLGELLLR